MLLNRLGNNDKRRWHRYPLGAPIRVVTQSTTIDARGITLSEGGMCLFALENIGVGTKIQVEFTDPRNSQLVRADAAIRNLPRQHRQCPDYLLESFCRRPLITLISCIFYVVTWEVIFLPGFWDKYGAHLAEKLTASGASPAAVQAKLQQAKKYKELYRTHSSTPC